MANLEQLKRLKLLTEAVYEGERSRFSKICAQEAHVYARIDELATMRPEANPVGAEHSAAGRVGADMQWQQWIEHRREILNRELMQVLALKEDQKEVYGRAFGRDLAAGRLEASHLASKPRKE